MTHSSGPLPPDGISGGMWAAISTNASSPREDVVYNVLSTDKYSQPLNSTGWPHNPSGCFPRPASSGLPRPCYQGAVRKGNYKLIVGYPGLCASAAISWPFSFS